MVLNNWSSFIIKFFILKQQRGGGRIYRGVKKSPLYKSNEFNIHSLLKIHLNVVSWDARVGFRVIQYFDYKSNVIIRSLSILGFHVPIGVSRPFVSKLRHHYFDRFNAKYLLQLSESKIKELKGLLEWSMISKQSFQLAPINNRNLR